MTGQSIEWNRAKYKRFLETYLKALETGAEMFVFDECEFIVPYAKYLIEYLDQQLPKE